MSCVEGLTGLGSEVDVGSFLLFPVFCWNPKSAAVDVDVSKKLKMSRLDAKEIKQLLKEAKENLKKDDYMGAAKACKTVLKKEPENFQANLLLGTSFREQGKYQQALEAYKKAIQSDQTQVYGWQGVISVYEKQNIKSHPDLLDAYKRVATFFEKDDKQKYIENTLKLAHILISHQDTAKALKVVGRLGKTVGLNVEISQLLVQLFNATSSNKRTTEEDELYTAALEVLVTETPQPAEETYRKYFSQLYRSQQYGKLALHCTGMQAQWNRFYSPMDWICRLYIESRIEHAQLVNIGGIEKITDILFKIHPSSRFGYFARGKYLIEEACKYAEGCSWINNALESVFSVHASLVLVRGKLKIGDYEGAMEEAEKAIVNCSDDNLADKENFQILFELLYLEALVGTNDNERANEKRLTLESTFKENPDHPQIVSYLDLNVRTVLKRKELSELKVLIESIEVKSTLDGLPLWRLDFYRAVHEASKTGEKFGTFIHSCVQTHNNLPELMLESAVFLYDYEEYEAAAVILTNLVATPAGKSHPHSWKYLGQLAHLEGNLQQAAKYFKRSYEANLDSDVGALLCDIYHELGEFQSKKDLLTDAKTRVRKTKSKWVWSRLGLMYLEEGKLLEAVDSLQAAIRVDINDGFLWEALADAYFYRGSLTAALRCYRKALLQQVDPLYPNMRISAIFQFLEEEDKSIAGLKELLEQHPNNAPLRVELARLYCWVAGEKMKENFDKGAISSVENGLDCVVKAILYSDKTMILPWMMVGDFSITLGDLPEETELHVPLLLLNSSKPVTDYQEMMKVEKVNLKRFKEVGTLALLQAHQIFVNAEDTSIQSSRELFGYINHQLTLSYYKRSCTIPEEETRRHLQLTAMHYCKKAIAKCSNNSLYWNTLGLIAFRLSDAALSQHCYIRSLQFDPNNVVAWGNLGILYYKKEQYILAHKAFSKGQSVAPVYANSWIGQGLCAEVLQPTEAPDLFRHACLLKPHPFAIVSYGNAICDLLLNPTGDESEDRQYWYWHLLTRMDAVTHLYDLITRIEGRAASPELFNLKGFVAGWNGFNQTALESFNTALKLAADISGSKKELTSEERFKIHSNKVSGLVALKMFEAAKEELVQFPNLDSTGLTNAALTLYKLNDLNTSIDMYKRILDLPAIEKKKPDVKIALALLANQTTGVDSAKNILFGKDMMKNSRALLTLGAIAVAQTDLHLLKAVIHELRPFQWTPSLASDIAFIQVCYQILQKSIKSAVNVVLKFIHMYPTNPKLYALACQVIIAYNLENVHVSIPRHLALCTLKVARIVGTSREESLFASKHSGIVSLTYLIESNVKIAVMATLKAIRCYPEQRDNWAVLACAYWMEYSKTKSQRLFLNIINILEREITLGLCSERIRDWMMSFRKEIGKYSGISVS
ncbi:Tetratricopeptide repeat protein 37 [Orchesella cincta]|uniref:Tetratricopeptide repeat protein 37 n=1 Tax=Orchesella cincta TaxID=48709 RepID=A0A1D2MZL1_ORCCI|nr:Tetratricopeptide repeat protein 37 [Orchesella cincta]